MKPSKHFDIIILGAGAAGLMCAANLPKNLNILIIEKTNKIGSKILISGGGKCNVVNEHVGEDDFLFDGKFLKPLFERVSPRDILNFFDGVQFCKRKKAQYFTKNGARDIVEFLRKKIRHRKLELNCEVKELRYEKHFICKTSRGDFSCDSFVVASGGLSFPSLGGSGVGYEIAKSFGHELSEPSPALVGLSLQKEQFWMKSLSGVSLKVKLSVADKTFTDELLFSHRGISGPAVLNASLFWHKGQIKLDFLSDGEIKNYLKNSKKQISSLLPLPKRFTKAFLAHLGLSDKVANKLSKAELEKLQTFHSYSFAPAGTFGFSKAEVSKGGVKTDSIDPLSYESSHQKGLYFLGEVLDVTGRLGGFNFYFAFGSAMLFAKNHYHFS